MLFSDVFPCRDAVDHKLKKFFLSKSKEMLYNQLVDYLSPLCGVEGITIKELYVDGKKIVKNDRGMFYNTFASCANPVIEWGMSDYLETVQVFYTYKNHSTYEDKTFDYVYREEIIYGLSKRK